MLENSEKCQKNPKKMLKKFKGGGVGQATKGKYVALVMGRGKGG